MSGPVWRIDDEDGDPELTGTPSPLLVTVRTLGDALVRTRPRWVAAIVLGALLGLGVLHLVPHPVTATSTLLMVSANSGDESAMTTDISLLQTREVADRVVDQLDLPESPEELLSSVSVTPVSNQIMTVSVDGPDDSAALARNTSLIAHYFQFREEQLRSVSAGLVQGYESRITTLQARVGELTREYNRLAAQTAVDQVRVSDIVGQRATLSTQVTDLQRAIEDATLQVDAAVSGTQVIDDPVTSSFGSLRQTVLVVMSGAVLGGVLSIGTILFRALTTERLHRRREVASALGVPVRVGVGHVPLPGVRGRMKEALTTRLAEVLRGHPRRWTRTLRRRHFEALVQGFETALTPRSANAADDSRLPAVASDVVEARSGPTTSLGLAAIDREVTGAAVVRGLADRLVDHGVRVLLVDLTASGALAGRKAVGTSQGRPDRPGLLRIHRPQGDPALASGPRRSGRHRNPTPGGPGPLDEAWDQVEVVLALAEVDPGLDLDILPTWVDRIVPLVSAGRANRELLSTIATLLIETGVDLPFALLEGADRADWTLGHPATPVDRPASEPLDGPTAIQAVQS
ncbi:hypothetical protein ACOCJ4_03730 [Knoellia sp. CPCC 206435]|uniref:hypothetical protein n=1 Tax=Knoellia terrae TaxID=3404797 RepID=UPI003B43D29E